MIETKTPGLQYYVDKISNLEPFSFIRYGDGEWEAAILHKKTQNCDGNSLRIPGLVRDLTQSLTHPYTTENYVMALRPASVSQVPRIGQWLEANVPEQVKWHDCRVFCHASIKGRLNPLVVALRNLEVPLVFIGPLHLQGLKGIFPRSQHIITPDTDSYNDKTSILEQVLAVEGPALFSFSAGPATKVFIHQLFPDLGKHSFMLDLGSLWSVYCGRKIRSYHKVLTKETIQKNLQ